MMQILTTKGRISRGAYWDFHVGVFVLFAVLGLLLNREWMPEWAKTLTGLLVSPVLFVAIIVQVKRWHDLDRSGVWVFINLIPLIGGLITLIFCFCIKGTTGANRYGPDLLEAPPPLPHGRL